MPRPLISSTFGLSYRKIPILAIGRDIYCDTSLIIEALESHFPASAGYGTIYPALTLPSAWNYRSLARGFASFWTDKPLFRTTTGLIPPTVWETHFGTDRAQLIGHALDAQKLRAKIPQNLAAFDLHLSLLEPAFSSPTWVFPTRDPSLADLSLYYQIRWGVDIAAGKGIADLTGGGTVDTAVDVAGCVWNAQRYPGLWRWFHAFEGFVAGLRDLETVVAPGEQAWKMRLQEVGFGGEHCSLLPVAAASTERLDERRGLRPGVRVSVVPDDTGRGDPTTGWLVGIGVEEVVVEPELQGEMRVRVHFPRLGFVVKALDGERAKL